MAANIIYFHSLSFISSLNYFLYYLVYETPENSEKCPPKHPVAQGDIIKCLVLFNQPKIFSSLPCKTKKSRKQSIENLQPENLLIDYKNSWWFIFLVCSFKQFELNHFRTNINVALFYHYQYKYPRSTHVSILLNQTTNKVQKTIANTEQMKHHKQK